MLNAKQWIPVSYEFSYFECQIISRLYAGRWAKSWGNRFYTLSYYIAEESRLRSHLLIHWRTHALGFSRKPNHISIRWLGHPNPNSLLLHYRSIPCLNTLVGSVRYLITLLKYRLYHYIVELFPTLLHCWVVPNANTLLRYTLSYYIAKQFPISILTELYPTLRQNWGTRYLIILLSNSQLLILCWAIPNPNTSLRYTKC